jgi:hypothetical protein
MTKQRFDGGDSEFTAWRRAQECLDSRLGYIATDVDFIWTNYKTGSWMMIEEKTYLKTFKTAQYNQFRVLDAAARNDPNYRGFYKITFERASPEDGKIYLNDRLVSKERLIEFLQFQYLPKPYEFEGEKNKPWNLNSY